MPGHGSFPTLFRGQATHGKARSTKERLSWNSPLLRVSPLGDTPDGKAISLHPLGILSQASQPNNAMNNMINMDAPVWDGKDPLTKLKPYLKELKGWLCTTRIPPKQHGWIILRKSTDSLKILINELDADTLSLEDSGHIVYDKIKKAYSEFLGTEKQYAGRD